MCAPDSLQSQALVDLIRQFGWSRIAVLASIKDYGKVSLVFKAKSQLSIDLAAVKTVLTVGT